MKNNLKNIYIYITNIACDLNRILYNSEESINQMIYYITFLRFCYGIEFRYVESMMNKSILSTTRMLGYKKQIFFLFFLTQGIVPKSYALLRFNRLNFPEASFIL
jgi:hypothetical protein